MPKVSVIIPLYNKEKYIRRTINSVLQQTITDFELLIIDDGSCDGSDKIVESIDDERIRLIRRPNGGQSAARNTGISCSSSDILAFLDADDQWLPTFLESILFLVNKFPEAGIYGTGYYTLFQNNVVKTVTLESLTHPEEEYFIVSDYFRKARMTSIVFPSSVAVHKRVFNKVTTFAEGEHRGGDRDMWARIALYFPMAYTSRVLAIYRSDAQGRENVRSDRHLQHPPFAKYAEQAFKKQGIPYEPAEDVREYVHHLWVGYSSSCILSGNRNELSYATDKLKYSKVFRQRYIYLRLAVLILPMQTLQFVNRLEKSRWVEMIKSRHRKFGVITSVQRGIPGSIAYTANDEE